MAHTVFGQFWPPMHQRAVLAAGGGTLTDTLHLVWAAITGVFFMFIVGFGAAALGKRFRVYSIATTRYIANEEPERLGKIESRQKSSLVREVTIAHLRKRGFSSAG